MNVSEFFARYMRTRCKGDRDAEIALRPVVGHVVFVCVYVYALDERLSATRGQYINCDIAGFEKIKTHRIEADSTGQMAGTSRIHLAPYL